MQFSWTVLNTAKVLNVFDLGLFVGSCVAVAGGCLMAHALVLVALARTGRPITAFLKMPCIEMIVFGWVAVAMSGQAAAFLKSPGNQRALRVVSDLSTRNYEWCELTRVLIHRQINLCRAGGGIPHAFVSWSLHSQCICRCCKQGSCLGSQGTHGQGELAW